MSERQPGSGTGRSRFVPPGRAPAFKRLRVMSSGRWHAPMHPAAAGPGTARLVAVGSARAGAGKSVVASNLACAIRGPRAARDPGRPRLLKTPQVHQLLGLVAPRESLSGWLDKKRRYIDEAPQHTRVRNLRVLPRADLSAEPMDRARRRALVQELHDVEGDVVVVDLGAETRDDLFDCFGQGAMRLLVTSRERADLEATYAFLESAARRAVRRHGEDAAAVLARFSGGLIGNATGAPEEEETFHAFARLVQDHLGIPLPVLGCLRSSDRIAQSIAGRLPLVARRGLDENVRTFHQMAEQMVVGPLADAESGECALDLPTPDLPAGVLRLPAELASYERQHTRFPVDWLATLELSMGVTEVRVLNVSESGAGIETPTALRPGDRVVLHLNQLPHRPALQAVVKNVVAALGRVGVAFVDPGDEGPRLVAAARQPVLPPANAD